MFFATGYKSQITWVFLDVVKEIYTFSSSLCLSRLYYTMRWVCVLVTSNIPKREKFSDVSYFCLRFHLRFGYQHFGIQNQHFGIQNPSETRHSVIRPLKYYLLFN